MKSVKLVGPGGFPAGIFLYPALPIKSGTLNIEGSVPGESTGKKMMVGAPPRVGAVTEALNNGKQPLITDKVIKTIRSQYLTGTLT
jgi:hypothetical protein